MSEKDYSGIIPFVYIGKEEIHKYMYIQYEVSMTINIGKIAN